MNIYCKYVLPRLIALTLNLEPVRATGSMSVAVFVRGLGTSVVVSWVAAYATAELCRRWAGEWVASRQGGAGQCIHSV